MFRKYIEILVMKDQPILDRSNILKRNLQCIVIHSLNSDGFFSRFKTILIGSCPCVELTSESVIKLRICDQLS